jgi:hypothetical protein
VNLGIVISFISFLIVSTFVEGRYLGDQEGELLDMVAVFFALPTFQASQTKNTRIVL